MSTATRRKAPLPRNAVVPLGPFRQWLVAVVGPPTGQVPGQRVSQIQRLARSAGINPDKLGCLHRGATQYVAVNTVDRAILAGPVVEVNGRPVFSISDLYPCCDGSGCSECDPASDNAPLSLSVVTTGRKPS